MKQIVIILFLSAVFISCKNEKKNISEGKQESSIELYNVINSDKIKWYSQDEITTLLNNKTLNNQIIIDSRLQINDTLRIRNIKTGIISKYATFRKDSTFCFKRDNITYFILNNLFFNYNSDSYYLTLENGKVHILFDSTNIHHSCFIPGFNSTLKRYKIILNKLNYSFGDTLKCRAFFINKGRYNDYSKDSTVYFLDSIDAKYIVHQYNKKTKLYISKFPK